MRGDGTRRSSREHIFLQQSEEERIKKRIYKNRAIAIADIVEYIDLFYNQTRRHSHLSVSPRNLRALHYVAELFTKSWEVHCCPVNGGL